MIKKILKFIFITIVGLFLLILISYYSFLGWEYITGNKYVDYLQNHSETTALENSFTFELVEDDIKKSKLILVGEIHGSREPSLYDYDFFTHLHKNFGVKTYVAEFDCVQAILLNEFMETGDQNLLHEILQNWAVEQGRNNQDYFDKYVKFHNYYQQLPAHEKFTFVGIDKVQDWALTLQYVNGLSTIDSSLTLIESTDEDYMAQLKLRLTKLTELYGENADTLFLLTHVMENISFVENKTNREKVMFENFNKLYHHQNLKDQKVYGFFGLFHIMQYRVNGKHPLASMIRTSDLGLEDKILSFNFLLNDSYMVMESKALPEFLRDEGRYTRMPISADFMLVMYIYGIQDFKRMTEENQKSIIKMNGENSPYEDSNRLNKTIQILPVTNVFKMTDKGKPYVQYTVFVRGSDWAKPMD